MYHEAKSSYIGNNRSLVTRTSKLHFLNNYLKAENPDTAYSDNQEVFGWRSNIIKSNDARRAIYFNGVLEQLSNVHWPKRV